MSKSLSSAAGRKGNRLPPHNAYRDAWQQASHKVMQSDAHVFACTYNSPKQGEELLGRLLVMTLVIYVESPWKAVMEPRAGIPEKD